ncbi:MAG: S41 family peptidase [Candidatus Gracilibacteria bacterium]|nr:S41 family peptidase [Candidatus Gracilibacteria bacterium]
MKQIKYIILSLIISLSILTSVNASQIDDLKSTVIKEVGVSDSGTTLTRADAFNFFSDYYLTDLAKSYKYINLNFKDVKKGTRTYESLQKLVYLDLIDNKSVKINPTYKISAYNFYFLSEKTLGEKIIDQSEVNKLRNNSANLVDMYIVKQLIEDKKNTDNTINLNSDALQNQKAIFDDVYNTILSRHYNKANINSTDMMYSAIQGLAAGSKDKFTTYFPPVEKKQFNEMLSGEYDGIGAYVDMVKPGEFRIISPLSGSPAEKAGIKANDIVTKIDNFEITTDTTSDEAVSKIKGLAGTKVKLTIVRGTDTLVIEVERAKITLKDVEGKSLSDDTYYMNIRIFGDNVTSDFKTSLNDLKTKTNTRKLIIDLRNDPGGYLDSVADILSYFVPAGENVAVVKYQGITQNYMSKGYTDYDFSKLKIVLLVNGGSASASEIMAGTLKDYYPNLNLVGEKTYGKGSVQTIKTYFDGSSLKYTIAHWFTGKTETGIDQIGIKPDIEIKLDETLMKSGTDNQLEKAKSL